jgi:hypothetical protein
VLSVEVDLRWLERGDREPELVVRLVSGVGMGDGDPLVTSERWLVVKAPHVSADLAHWGFAVTSLHMNPGTAAGC